MTGERQDSRLLIETLGLTKRFGGVTALKGIDFRLKEGELRCLIGPNGAGKSTFFKCLTGQYKASAGEVRLRGQCLRHLQGHDIAQRGVGIKTQVPNVFENLSVRENVWLAALRVFGRQGAREKSEEIMERLGLTHLAETTTSRLAHGQRQLVELAMVLAPDPDLILLDEPAAGMSDEEISRLVDIIKQLNQHGALVIVEHDMQFIREIATTVTVFHQGEVLVEGGVQDILDNETVRDVYLGKETERC